MTMRYDKVEIRAQRNDAGYITDTPILTRTGVFVYKGPDGKERREYRPPHVVFAADSLAGYKGLPITDGHPGKVTSANVKSHLCGTVVSPGRQDSDNLVAEIVIHDPTPVDGGKKELSVGYEVAFDETPGVSPEGERYDAVQISIKPNHLALVHKGRAGTARLNLDAADAVTTLEEEQMTLVKVKLDNGLAYDAAPEVDQEVNTLRAKLVAATAATDAATARADSLDSELKSTKDSIVQLKQDAVEQAKTRIQLETDAKARGVTLKQDATDRELQEAVVKAVRGADFNMDGKTDAYVAAAYDLAIADQSTRKVVVAEARKEMKQDAAPADAAKDFSAGAARARYKAGLAQ